MSVSRSIRLGGQKSVQLRLDVFNPLNEARITGRVTNMTLTSPAANASPTNLPYDSNGNLIVERSRPRGAGFGVVNNYQAPRTIQMQVKFLF
jgi:hypothetical protein